MIDSQSKHCRPAEHEPHSRRWASTRRGSPAAGSAVLLHATPSAAQISWHGCDGALVPTFSSETRGHRPHQRGQDQLPPLRNWTPASEPKLVTIDIVGDGVALARLPKLHKNSRYRGAVGSALFTGCMST